MTPDIWRHGKYVDTWSLVHLLSGFLLVSTFYWYGFALAEVMGLSISLLLLWEAFEAMIKIIEPSANVVMDIIIGIAGAWAGAYLYFFAGWEFSAVLYYGTLAFTLLLSLWGFLDFMKRGYR